MLSLIVRSAVILAAAFGAARLLRGAPAALRHFTWTVAFLALLVLPALDRVAPKWEPAATGSGIAAVVSGAAVAVPAPSSSSPAPASRADLLMLIRWLGTAAAAAWFLAGVARTAWARRRAVPAGYARAQLAELGLELGVPKIAVLESYAIGVPVAWGIFRPVVMLPADAAGWPAPKLRTVLLHELAHIRRRDVLSQTLAQIACCLFWFQPLVWLAARRLRMERERACDDAVLLRGVAAHEYAGHLMDLVRTLAARRAGWSDAPAMAEVSDLETRVRALLDRNLDRSPLSRRAAAAVAAGALTVLLPLAAVTARAQASRGSISGAVEDPSGARIPNCQVVAKNLDSANQEITRCDAAGEYRFNSIAAGRYALEFRAPGFKPGKQDVIVVGGAASAYVARLELGEVSEAVTVRGSRTAPAATQPARTPARVRVGGNVQPLRLLRQTKPVYPDDLKQQGIQGTVLIRAIVSTTGEPLNPQVVNSDIDARLAQAALDAVRQWRYTPTLLNGQPVETATTINVTFELGQ